MSSEWQKLDTLWYRKREIYQAQWDDYPDRLHACVVAGAPYGGPVAMVRDENVFQAVHGSLKPELQTWTSAGRFIASTPWTHRGLVSMSWSSQELLVCVFDTGVIIIFNVMCEELKRFTVDERIKSDGGVRLAALWDTGAALLTARNTLFVNCSFQRSGDACYRCEDLRIPADEAPLCMCVLPPPHEDSADVQVLVGTAQGPVLLADRHHVRDLGFEDGPYMAFSVSSSGRLLACLSTRGVFTVLRVNNLTKALETAHIECKNRPKQMVWCGDDCIALYLVVGTPSGTWQHLLFVGGPRNDWIPYQYDSPIHLVSECDGFRILGTHKVEFVQRVPVSTEAIYSVGNCDPPAMLCYAFERFEKGDVCAQESLRLIKDDLPDAVSTCIEAASFEYEVKTVEDLLNAAVFGRHFLPEPLADGPATFVRTCRDLRICIALRKPPIDIPLTVPQLEQLGFAGLALRLSQRHQHLTAYRICEWVGHPREQVLFHWAEEKIKAARRSSANDDELCEAILSKFRKASVTTGFAQVARTAAEMCRPNLATMLLNHEPRGTAQVKVLLQLSREGVDENRVMMLRLALDKACQSYDPDLLYGVVSLACMHGDPCEPQADFTQLVSLIKEKPNETGLMADYLAAQLRKSEQFGSGRRFNDQLGRTRKAAEDAVMEVFLKRDPQDRRTFLRNVKEAFSATDGEMREADRLAMQLGAQCSAEEQELLKLQEEYEVMSVQQHWQNGPHQFAGISLVDTLRKLLELKEILEADKLRGAFKITDKRYWRIKIRALCDAGYVEELKLLADNRTSPIGYEAFVESFLKLQREDLARPFVSKIKDFAVQADFYERMGMAEEAQAAMKQSQQQSAGFGGQLSRLFKGNG